MLNTKRERINEPQKKKNFNKKSPNNKIQRRNIKKNIKKQNNNNFR